MKRCRNAGNTSMNVKMTVTLPVEVYQDLAALAACTGTSAATHAAKLIHHHLRALHSEVRRDPTDYRLDT